MNINANGVTLEYESFGDPANPTILLVMGLGAQMILWPDDFCARLAAAGFHVVRFDNRDAGLSTQLDHLGTPNIGLQAVKYALHLPISAPYRLDDMARDTAALLDALNIPRAHVVGASMGGMIAQNLAADFPEKVITLTSIMSTTGKRSLPPPTSRARKAMLAPPKKGETLEGAAQRMMRILRTIGSRTYPPDEGWIRDVSTRHMQRRNNPGGAARQLVAIVASGDRTPTVKRIKVPTLVIHGDEDPLLRLPCGQDTAKVIREAGGDVALEVYKGMGHDLPFPLMARIVERISRHAQAASRAPAR